MDIKHFPLRAERLMAHMRALCKDIGPRPPTSPQERQAAEYVRQTLADLGIEAAQEQRFKSVSTFGWVTVPTLAAASLAMPLARLGGLLGKLAGGLVLLGGTWTLRNMSLVKPQPLAKLAPRGESQNVVAVIPPAGETKRRLYLVGHLDSNKQRFLFPLPIPALERIANAAAMLAAVLGGLSLLVDVLRGRRKLSWWQWLLGLSPVSLLPMMALDETQPYIEGANDNATAVSILLGMAEVLQEQPLQHTEVRLLFTGCEEVGCVGMEAYLETFSPSPADSYWIDLEMVGTGGLCYVTRHGINYLAQYQPSPTMVALAARAAQKHPELAVSGKDMLMVEEIANLVRHGQKAVCIAGYDEAGFLPNWHRVSDTLENIEPDTLARAAQYTWALMHEVDAL